MKFSWVLALSFVVIAAAMTAVPEYAPQQVFSFTTRSGKEYQSVSVYEVTPLGGLRLQTQNGPVYIPFSEIPEDVSVFPEEVRAKIERRRQGVGPRNFGNPGGLAAPTPTPIDPVEIALFPTWESQGQGPKRCAAI